MLDIFIKSQILETFQLKLQTFMQGVILKMQSKTLNAKEKEKDCLIQFL